MIVEIKMIFIGTTKFTPKNRSEPVFFGCVDRKRMVLGGPVRSLQYLGRSWTGCGPRLRVLGAKNRTELDLKTLVMVLGRCCRPWVLVVREWGVVVGRMRSPFVGGVVPSCCLWAVGLVLGAGHGSLALGSHLWAPSCRLWAVGLVRVRYMFVGAGFMGGACSWAGGCCSWVLGCRLWARWCRVVCRGDR
jgi:hypothetical protein